MAVSQDQKIYVLDTSVLMHDPDAIEKFGDNVVVVPIWVIEELDHLKMLEHTKGAMAREASRRIEAYRVQGSLHDGVRMASGGMLRVDHKTIQLKRLPAKLTRDCTDHRILAIAFRCQQLEEPKRNGLNRQVILVTKDINLRIKADACGILAEDYKNDKRIKNLDELHSGVCEIALEYAPDGFLAELFAKKSISLTTVLDMTCRSAMPELFPNICCTLLVPSERGNRRISTLYKKNGTGDDGCFELTPHNEKTLNSRVKPASFEQWYAYALLMDPSIRIVSLVGRAGTGKTLIALLAAYQQLRPPYKQIVVYRPNIELGKSLGYLPGTVEEKFDPWTKPITDNLNFILNGDGEDEDMGDHGSRRRPRHMSEKPRSADVREYIESGMLEISPINYVRGRSLNRVFMIIDEAQNLTPNEIKTLVTRAGRNTKVVITGDLSQIDNPYLDPLSNGLSYTVDRLVQESMFGHIILKKSLRSDVSELAAALL